MHHGAWLMVFKFQYVVTVKIASQLSLDPSITIFGPGKDKEQVVRNGRDVHSETLGS